MNKASYVFNYDFPPDMEEYVYRFSMTGMQGKMGESISLLAEGDWRYAEELVGIMEEDDQEVPDWLRRESKPFKAWKERKDQENVTTEDAEIMDLLLGDIVVRPLYQPAIVRVETMGDEEVGMIISSLPSSEDFKKIEENIDEIIRKQQIESPEFAGKSGVVGV